MGKLSIATLFAAASMIALPAAAADMHANTVRIPVSGKSHPQIMREIDDAAFTVCGVAAVDAACVTDARLDAHRQLDRIEQAGQPARKVDAATSVRISLKGKSRAEILQEIDAAAQSVCQDLFSVEHRECVAQAVGAAKRQLAADTRFNALALN